MKILHLLADDSSPDDPSEFDGAWKLYSFNRRHRSYKDPQAFFPDGKPSIGLRRKLDVGTAFVLDYFEHGNCVWSISGGGPECAWDTSHGAGLLVWEHPVKDMGAKTRDGREKDARLFLETYTCWCNGEVYGYSIDEVVTLPCGHTETRHVDSCFGFYGNDIAYMAEQVRAAIDGDQNVTIKGDAKHLADYHDFTSAPKKETGDVQRPEQ